MNYDTNYTPGHNNSSVGGSSTIHGAADPGR